jgi:hypothetical protein
MIEMGESYHRVYEAAIRGLENIQEETKGYLDQAKVQAKELLEQATEQATATKHNNQELSHESRTRYTAPYLWNARPTGATCNSSL